MASYATNKGKYESLLLAAASQDLRVLLVTAPPANSGAAADLNFVADISSVECAGGSYARKALSSIALTEDDTNDYGKLSAANPSTYSALQLTGTNLIAGAWIYRQVTNDSDSPLWYFLDVTDFPTNGGDVTINFDSTNGLADYV